VRSPNVFVKTRTIWTESRINQLLLLVINEHVKGAPDYEYLAEQLGGGVTPDGVRLKFQALRRGGSGGSTPSPKKGRTGKKMLDTDVKHEPSGADLGGKDAQKGSNCASSMPEFAVKTEKGLKRERCSDDEMDWI
jgi:hypothetical protein